MTNEKGGCCVYRTLGILVQNHFSKKYQKETQQWVIDLFLHYYSLKQYQNKKTNEIHSLNRTICSLLNYSHKLKIQNYKEFDWDFHPDLGNRYY